MGTGIGTVTTLSHPTPIPACRLVVRREKRLSEVVEFIKAGIEVGQQAVVMAGPACLKDLALNLSGSGVRPEALLRSSRLIFLTAPDCLSQLTSRPNPSQRGSLRLNGSVLRWVTDWSWVFENAQHPSSLPAYQSRVHEFVRRLTHLSLCTVHCEKLARSALLAMIADHRRAARPTGPVVRPV